MLMPPTRSSWAHLGVCIFIKDSGTSTHVLSRLKAHGFLTIPLRHTASITEHLLARSPLGVPFINSHDKHPSTCLIALPGHAPSSAAQRGLCCGLQVPQRAGERRHGHPDRAALRCRRRARHSGIRCYGRHRHQQRLHPGFRHSDLCHRPDQQGVCMELAGTNKTMLAQGCVDGYTNHNATSASLLCAQRWCHSNTGHFLAKC